MMPLESTLVSHASKLPEGQAPLYRLLLRVAAIVLLMLVATAMALRFLPRGTLAPAHLRYVYYAHGFLFFAAEATACFVALRLTGRLSWLLPFVFLPLDYIASTSMSLLSIPINRIGAFTLSVNLLSVLAPLSLATALFLGRRDGLPGLFTAAAASELLAGLMFAVFRWSFLVSGSDALREVVLPFAQAFGFLANLLFALALLHGCHPPHGSGHLRGEDAIAVQPDTDQPHPATTGDTATAKGSFLLLLGGAGSISAALALCLMATLHCPGLISRAPVSAHGTTGRWVLGATTVFGLGALLSPFGFLGAALRGERLGFGAALLLWAGSLSAWFAPTHGRLGPENLTPLVLLAAGLFFGGLTLSAGRRRAAPATGLLAGLAYVLAALFLAILAMIQVGLVDRSLGFHGDFILLVAVVHGTALHLLGATWFFAFAAEDREASLTPHA